MTPRLAASLLFLPLATAFADTIELKSGEVIQGRITSATADAISVEIQFSPTIVDERVLARSDVAHFAVESGDEAAFAKIRDLASPDTALTPAACQEIIDKQLRPFLRTFPDSARVPDVQSKIRDLSAEVERLRGGDVKVAGIWYAQSDFAAEKYQLEAAARLEEMRRAIDAKDYPAAMNSFEVLLRAYPNSLAFVESVKLARKALPRLQQQLNLELGNLPQTKARRQAAIDRTPVEQRQPIQQAIAAEDARAAALAALAQKNAQRFYPIFAFDEKGLASMQAAASQIGKQLETLDDATLAQRAALARQAAREIADHQLAAAETTLPQLKTAWPTYEGLGRLEQKLAAAQAANAASSAAAEKSIAAPKKP